MLKGAVHLVFVDSAALFGRVDIDAARGVGGARGFAHALIIGQARREGDA
jgi:hypothetical protein